MSRAGGSVAAIQRANDPNLSQQQLAETTILDQRHLREAIAQQNNELVRAIVEEGNQARKFLEVKRLREKLFNESRSRPITINGQDDELQREHVSRSSMNSNKSFTRDSVILQRKKSQPNGDFMSGALTILQQEGLKSSLVRHTQLLQKKDAPQAKDNRFNFNQNYRGASILSSDNASLNEQSMNMLSMEARRKLLNDENKLTARVMTDVLNKNSTNKEYQRKIKRMAGNEVDKNGHLLFEQPSRSDSHRTFHSEVRVSQKKSPDSL